MINPHKIFKLVKQKLKWLIVTHWGRIVLGSILMILGGIFSQHSTIEFLSTDLQIFDYIVAAGILIYVFEFLWMMGALGQHLYNKWF